MTSNIYILIINHMPLSKQLALARKSCFDPEANLQYTLLIELINSNHYVALIDI